MQSLIPDFNNSILDFESLDEFINNYDFLTADQLNEEEMFKRSQHSAFLPFQKPTLQLMSNSLPSLFMGKMELPSLERFPSNKPSSQKEDEGLFGN